MLIAADDKAKKDKPKLPDGKPAICYTSKEGDSDLLLLVSKEDKSDLKTKGLKKIDCPDELEWTAEAAIKQCGVLSIYDEEQQAEYLAYHGVTPEEVCANGKEAAGIVEGEG